MPRIHVSQSLPSQVEIIEAKKKVYECLESWARASRSQCFKANEKECEGDPSLVGKARCARYLMN